MSDKPYKVVIPGIEGSGAQVFEADTPEEMQQQFQKAQENATSLIRQQAQRLEALEQQMQQTSPQGGSQPGPDGFDKQKYFNLLYENPVEAQKYAFSFAFGVSPEEFQQDYQQVRQGALLGIQNSVNAQFAQKHPELLQVSQENDIHNAEQISKILNENGWSYNLNNLEAAYAVAKTSGKLKLQEQSQFPTEVQMAPVPSTVSRPTGQVNTSLAEEEYLATAPLAEVKKYLEKKYANQHG